MRTFIKSVFFILVLILSGISGTMQAQKSILLTYDLEAGQQYDYQINMDQDIVFETGGQTMTLDQIMSFGTTTKVLYSSSDSINILTTIDKIQMDQQIFGMQLKYDSDDQSTHSGMGAQMAEAMNPLIHANYTTTIDNRGKVIQVDFGKLVGNNEIAGNLNSANNFCIYPEYKVKVGDSWETDIAPMEGSDSKVHAKYTIKSISESDVILDYAGQLSGNSLDGDTVNLSGIQTGEMTVDKKTGWLIKSTIEQDIKMEMEKEGNKFPATITGIVTIVSTKK